MEISHLNPFVQLIHAKKNEKKRKIWWDFAGTELGRTTFL
jgi:hypothetical protein